MARGATLEPEFWIWIVLTLRLGLLVPDFVTQAGA